MPSVIVREIDPMSDGGVRFATDVRIPSDSAEARRVQEDIERLLRVQQYTDHEIFSIRLALEEALVNAIKHGNGHDRAKTLRIAYRVDRDRFDILIADQGPGFDPCTVPDPTAEENLERPCGRGLMLMRHYMSHVVFRGCGNAVVMCKLRNGCQSA